MPIMHRTTHYIIIVIEKNPTPIDTGDQVHFKTCYLHYNRRSDIFEVVDDPRQAELFDTRNEARELALLFKGHIVERPPTREPKEYWWTRD